MSRFLFAGLVSAIAFVPAISWAAPVQRTAPISGKIVSAKTGETLVMVRTSSSRPAEVRQDLKAGDLLRTNSKGTLAVVFADRTQIRLARNSVLRVNSVKRGSPSSMTLQSGRVWGRTPRGEGSNLSVETPAVTAGIRGTEWAISVDGDTTSLQVFSGIVQMTNEQGSLSVAGGQAGRAVRGQAPTRVALVNPEGREQMLYFVALADGLDLFAGSGVPGFAEARRGQWKAARAAFAGAPKSAREAAIASFGDYIAAVNLGEDRPVPEIRPGDPISYVARAYILSFAGELDEAIATADAGLARHPEESALYEVKARAALLLGDEVRARQAIESALARDSDDAAALALRSEFNLHYAGDPYRALEDAQRAVELQPERIGSYRSLSDVRLERGGTREALNATDAALARDPESAALHAERAEILLSQKRMRKAHSDIERALELDPSLSVVRTDLSEYYLLRGNEDKALEEGLAASAGNPAYSRALLQLAEIYYRLGDIKSAMQQLDAADRLDPHSPLTPLARTAVALHRYNADQAILSANEALKRFRARGGVYSNLSENRETGSLVSQAFRFLELEGWGRYYADRVFDTFTPSSYFDQALNQTPGPFVVRDDDGNFDVNAAEDLDQISSFLQGVALDPLSVANSERLLQFDNGSFFETQLGGDYLIEDRRQRLGGQAKVNAITLSPFPVALGLEAEYSDFDDERLRPDLGISPLGDFTSFNKGGDETFVQAYAGFEPGAYDQLAVAAGYVENNSQALSEIDDGTSPMTFPRESIAEKQYLGLGLWSHEFGYRSRATLAGGFGHFKTTRQNSFSLDDIGTVPGIPARITATELKFTYLSANLLQSFGYLDVRAGAELADYDVSTQSAVIDILDPSVQPLGTPVSIVSYKELRGYLDLRYRASNFLILEGQANIVDLDIGVRIAGGPSLGSARRTEFDYRLGAAVEPAPGQWIRLATLRETHTLFPLTFRPVNVVGLKGNIFPKNDVYRSRSHVLRWDAQWSRHFFTALELQDQRLDGVDYSVPDSSIDISGGPVRLQRIGLEANWWLGGNFGLRTSYAYTHSEIRGAFQSGLATVGSILVSGFGCTTADEPRVSCRYRVGDQLPFVPKHVGRASLVWTAPAPIRVRAALAASYIGGQIDDRKNAVGDFVVADAKVEWEPLDRRLFVSAQVLNLFDRNYSSARSVAAPGRTLVLSGKVRF